MIGCYRIGGHEAMTRKNLRQAIKALAQACDDPRFDDWDDEMILHILSEIIDRHRQRQNHTMLINLTGNRIMSTEDINELMTKLSQRLGEED